MKSLCGFVLMVMLLQMVPLFAAPQYKIEEEKTVEVSGQVVGKDKVLEKDTQCFVQNSELLAMFNEHMEKVMASCCVVHTSANIGGFLYDVSPGELLALDELIFDGDIATTLSLVTGENAGLWIEINGVNYSNVNKNSSGFIYQEQEEVFGSANVNKKFRVYSYGMPNDNHPAIGSMTDAVLARGQSLFGVFCLLLIFVIGFIGAHLRHMTR